MKEVALGAKTYFVREEGDERKEILFGLMWLGPGAPPPTFQPDLTDVWVQDADGKLVAVHDKLTVEQVKKASALATEKRAAGQSEWKKAFGRWLDDEIAAGRVLRKPHNPYGPSWHIPRTKKDVHDILKLEISLSTFSTQTRPGVYNHKGLPVRWVNGGGRPKRASA